MYVFFVPLIVVAVIVAPIIRAILRQKRGIKIDAKKAIWGNIFSFAGCVVVFAFALPLGIAAAESGDTVVAAANGMSDGLRYLAAGLSTGLGSIGTGIAVGAAAPAAIGAISENEKNMPKALIFVALGEGIAIYGLLVSILLLFAV